MHEHHVRQKDQDKSCRQKFWGTWSLSKTKVFENYDSSRWKSYWVQPIYGKGTAFVLSNQFGGTILCLASDGRGFSDVWVCSEDVNYKTLAHPTKSWWLLWHETLDNYASCMLKCCWLPRVKGHSNVPANLYPPLLLWSKQQKKTGEQCIHEWILLPLLHLVFVYCIGWKVCVGFPPVGNLDSEELERHVVAAKSVPPAGCSESGDINVPFVSWVALGKAHWSPGWLEWKSSVERERCFFKNGQKMAKKLEKQIKKHPSLSVLVLSTRLLIDWHTSLVKPFPYLHLPKSNSNPRAKFGAQCLIGRLKQREGQDVPRLGTRINQSSGETLPGPWLVNLT